jgi:KUP system potassium uptake protein
MVPEWGLYPLIALTTCATIIASQAVISGLFSVVKQAILLGYLPRMQIRHTSAREMGQIYIPRMNWVLMIGVIFLVVTFQSSGNLAAAYGIAVTGVVMIDSLLAAFVAITIWRWSKPVSIIVFGTLLIVDIFFFSSTLLKIPEGGWFPVLVAGLVFLLVSSWRNGRRVAYAKIYKDALPLKDFLANLDSRHPRVAGTAVFLTADSKRTPKALLYNMKHNKVMHERIIVMRVKIRDVPWVPDMTRVETLTLGHNFHAVTANYGFLDQPNVPRALEQCALHGLEVDTSTVSYFLNRQTLIPSKAPDMGPVQERIYIALSAMAQGATDFFKLPPDQVLELGTQIEI